eukprot:m51a1_g6579 hypothetical protein (123) ;mRNA; r:207752-208184
MNASRVIAIVAAVAAVALASCDNSGDRSVLAAQAATFAQTLQTCATQCSSRACCTTACLSTATQLTTSCAECFGEYRACVDRHCARACSVHPMGQACLDCQAGICMTTLVACASIPADAIPL